MPIWRIYEQPLIGHSPPIPLPLENWLTNIANFTKVEGMIIPAENLEKETLRRVVEEFVSREGTDYGHADRSMDSKINSVISGLERKDYFLTFDPDSHSCNIISKSDLSQFQ